MSLNPGKSMLHFIHDQRKKLNVVACMYYFLPSIIKRLEKIAEHHCHDLFSYTANFATHKIHMKFIYTYLHVITEDRSRDNKRVWFENSRVLSHFTNASSSIRNKVTILKDKRAKWCIHLSLGLFLYINYLMYVTAGGPVSPLGPQSFCNRSFGFVFVLSRCFLYFWIVLSV